MIIGMSINDLLKPLKKLDLKKLSRQELESLFLAEQALRLQRDEEKIVLEEKYVLIKSKIFAPSSEKSQIEKNPNKKKGSKKRKSHSKDLIERYPNLEIKEELITLETPPSCDCCQSTMSSSGMTEDSEYLTVIPKKYIIVKQKREKYRCHKCHGSLIVAPGRNRIAPGSSYGDELVLDASLSKFCDLIPMERYSMMAERSGVKNLPANSLIGLSHFLAEFVRKSYELLKKEVQLCRVLQADETPHKMLEGSEKKNWYLWAFQGGNAIYFEFQETRSGDVASSFLKDSNCEVLLSDVYGGYGKAIRESNNYRREHQRREIIASYCNAHARRKFKEAEHPFQEQAGFYIDQYREIYKLESESKEKSVENRKLAREEMKYYFEIMKERTKKDLASVSSRSSLATAINYFLNNYEGLTYPLRDIEVSLDNNSTERAIRNPVIGRKTWYGTHSIRGAKTAAVLFSLVESCKMNQINPREFFKELVASIHKGIPPFTPHQYVLRKKVPI